MPTPVNKAAPGDRYNIAVHPGSCSILKYFLNPAVPFVFVADFTPNERLEWWDCEMPLRPHGPSRTLRVRNMAFDILMPTEEFLELLEDLEPNGIELYQCTRPIPDTLVVHRINPGQRQQILIDNGTCAGFLLPHRYEVAVYWTIDQSEFERIRAIPEVRNVMLNE